MTDFENQEAPAEYLAPEQAQEQNYEAPQQEVPKESDQEMNFRQLREKADRLEKERDQDRQMMMKLQDEILNSRQAPQQQYQQQAPQEPDEFADVDRSDWATIDQSERMAQRVADARIEKKWNEYKRKEQEEQAKKLKEEAPSRVRAKFPDFDSVVTKESMTLLQKMEPDIFKALGDISNEESQAIAAYKYVSKFLPDATQGEMTRQRLQENSMKPKSLSSTGGSSPLSQAGAFEQGLTPALQKQLLAEMNAAARRG